MNDEDPEEGLRDLVDLALKQIVNKHDVTKLQYSFETVVIISFWMLQVADKDKDNRLSRGDFVVAVMKNDLLTEILGKWMPNADVSARVLWKTVCTALYSVQLNTDLFLIEGKRTLPERNPGRRNDLKIYVKYDVNLHTCTTYVVLNQSQLPFTNNVCHKQRRYFFDYQY